MFKVNFRAGLIIKFCDVIVLSIFTTIFFWLITSTTSDPSFLSNYFTGGSDDYMYLTSSIQAVSSRDNSDLSEIISNYYDFSLHSPGYPLLLYLLFYLLAPSIFFAIFLNSISLWISVYCSPGQVMGLNSNLIKLVAILLSMPGLLLVSFHIYKDLILLMLMLLSLYNYQKRNYTLAILLAIITHFFRPFNGILMVFALLFAKRPLLVFILVAIAYITTLIFPDVFDMSVFESQIQYSQSIAILDMQSYGSTYEPSGIFLIDYLIGLFRFFLLPFPFSINWFGRPLFFSFLLFLQSLIIYLTLILALFSPGVIFKSIKDNSILFAYTFLQGSTYSIIYYGNSEPRYRLVMYICFGILFRNLLLNFKSKL